MAILFSVTAGGMFGYFAAWKLAFYVPGEAERELLLTAGVAVVVLSLILVAVRGFGLNRLALSWILVAAASTYLWTSSTFDADIRQQAYMDTFGVLETRGFEDEGAIVDARLTVDGSSATLTVDSAPGTHPLFFVLAPAAPDGCAAYGHLHGQTVFACTAPASLRFKDVVSYSWAAPAMETAGVSIAAGDSWNELGVLPVAAVPVDVTFETYPRNDDDRLFERPVLGNATLDQYTVSYSANAQTVAAEDWSAVVQYRLPRGVALLSLARDFSLILLGGAVSLFLMPRWSRVSTQLTPPVPDVPVIPADGAAGRNRSRIAERRSPALRRRRASSATILGSLAVVGLAVLRAVWPRRR